jgi:hypothetical protein
MNESFREKVLAVQAKYNLPSWDAAFQIWMEESGQTGSFGRPPRTAAVVEARWDSPARSKASSGLPDQSPAALSENKGSNHSGGDPVSIGKASHPDWSEDELDAFLWETVWT